MQMISLLHILEILQTPEPLRNPEEKQRLKNWETALWKSIEELDSSPAGETAAYETIPEETQQAAAVLMAKERLRRLPGQDDDRLLNYRDLMEILHISQDRAYQLLRSKAFPGIRIGNRMYVTRKRLNNWLDLYTGRQFLV